MSLRINFFTSLYRQTRHYRREASSTLVDYVKKESEHLDLRQVSKLW